MNYEMFLETIKAELKPYYDEDTQIIIHKIIKNNSLELDSLSILAKNQHLSQAIYLNDYYTEFCEGKSISEIIIEILNIFKDENLAIPFRIEDFKDFTKVRQHIVYKLINFQKNQKLLQTVPFNRILDLALVFYVIFPMNEMENATILIQNEHLALWGISHDTLFTIAKENTPHLLRPRLKKMSDFIEEFVLEEYPDLETSLEELLPDPSDDEAIPMYVLTNHLRLNGSAALLYDGILSAFADRLGQDLYVLPSSIHEVILVPVNGMISKKALQRMVKEVNLQEVSEQERLSNQIYIFHKDTDTLTI